MIYAVLIKYARLVMHKFVSDSAERFGPCVNVIQKIFRLHRTKFFIPNCS